MRDHFAISNEHCAYRYFAGVSEVETAVAVGVAVGTVKSRTARALAKLRIEMGQR